MCPGNPDKHPVEVEAVACPLCNSEGSVKVAEGPDFDLHCCGDQLFSLVKCRRCNLHYLNPRPTAAMLPRIYAAEKYYAYRFSEEGNAWVLRARRKRDRKKIREVFQHLPIPLQLLKVLDVGAGDGALLESFQAGGIPASGLFGLDLEVGAVESLRRKGFHGVQGRAEDMEFPPQSFHMVTMIQVLEHLASPGAILANIFQMLKPGGILLVETPNIEGWDRHFFAGRTWGGYHFPRHWVLWSKAALVSLLKQFGFEVVASSTPAAAVTWAWSINHVLQETGCPAWILNLFSLRNPLTLGLFWAIDFIPSLLQRSSNLRLIARRH